MEKFQDSMLLEKPWEPFTEKTDWEEILFLIVLFSEELLLELLLEIMTPLPGPTGLIEQVVK